MATPLAGLVGLPVASTPLPSSDGATAAPASTGAEAVFAQMINTLAEATLQSKTVPSQSKNVAPTTAQQTPSAGQALPPAGDAAAPGSTGAKAVFAQTINTLAAATPQPKTVPSQSKNVAPTTAQQTPSAGQALPSGGEAAAPGSTGAKGVFAQTINTLAEATPQPKTAPSLSKNVAPTTAQQTPSAGQALRKDPHPSGTTAALPLQPPAKAGQSAGRAAARTRQRSEAAPQSKDSDPSAAAAAIIAPPPIPASAPASAQPTMTGQVHNDPHNAAVGITAAPSSGGAEPPGTIANAPSATAAASASESLSAAPLTVPGGPSSDATPQASPLPLAIPATAAAISAAPAPLATTAAAPPVAQTTTPAPAPASTAPAAQIAPTLISVAQSASGTQHLTIRLDPPELGTVQIRVEHPTDAPVQVEINVQRPETLTLLMRDQPHLQHALDQAGVPAEGRTLSFQLDPQDQRGTAGDPGSGHGRRAPTPHSAAQQMQAEQDDPSGPTAGTMRWSRVALDITA
jgi:flagellar hook-length control protein FliK